MRRDTEKIGIVSLKKRGIPFKGFIPSKKGYKEGTRRRIPGYQKDEIFAR